MTAFALAHYYLSSIDLFGNDDAGGFKMGDLEFMYSHDINYSYNIGVTSEDPITASLLQARLIELGHNTSVEIVDGARGICICSSPAKVESEARVALKYVGVAGLIAQPAH